MKIGFVKKKKKIVVIFDSRRRELILRCGKAQATVLLIMVRPEKYQRHWFVRKI